MQRFCSFGLNHISFQKEELGVPLRCFGCHWMHASIRLTNAFLGLLRKCFDKTADKFSMLVGQAYSSDVSRKCSSYLVFRLLDPILWSVSFFRHGDCLQKCKFLWQRRKWGGGGTVVVQHWIPVKYGMHSQTAITLSWSLSCEHCHWLSLLRAGFRLDCSHSYPLLCHIFS